MQKYRVVEVTEAEFEDLVRQAPELIEEGLQFVDHQTFTARGPLDVLMVDSGHALVVAELKVTEDDGMLVQGIDYYDYILTNLEGFARAYSQYQIDPTQDPRLLLVAPSFSVTLLNRIKWIEIPLSLFTFQCIELENAQGEPLPVYKEVTAPGAPEIVEAYSLEDRYAYITNKDMRELARDLVSQMEQWDRQRISVDPTKTDISVKRSGQVLAYVHPRRKYFVVSGYDSEGKWTSHPVNSEADVEKVMSFVQACFERLVH